VRPFAFALLAGAAATFAPEAWELKPGTRVELATAAEGARLLSSRDAFVEEMSPFDRGARLKTDRDVSEAEYLAFAGSQARDWTAAEKTRLEEILGAFRQKTAGLDLPLPPAVVFVKTTGLEEGRAAYCRGASVVLPQGLVDGDPAQLSETVFHELFHVYRTHNPGKRAALYRIVGFAPSAQIPLPEPLARRKLTNPDAPRIDSVIRVKVDGVATPVTPVILGAADRYDVSRGGEFFQQMQFRLLVLDERGGSFRPAGESPRLLEPSQTLDYLEQTGRNTQYVIHPEEILADNFVQLVNGRADAPTPRILEELGALLKK
jgi:hypothetical protein